MKKFFSKNLNSKGAVMIFLVMSILVAILVIALGSSFILSNELRSSLSSSDSVKAYYAAETGIEEAMYNISQGNEPDSAIVTCVASPSSCTVNSTGNASPPDYASTSVKFVSTGGDAKYYINVTGCMCNYTISRIQSIGEYNGINRSVEIVF